MDVKRGHRRRLQREIATIKGIPSNIPLYFQHGEEISDGQIHSSNNSIHQPPLNNVQPKILYVNGPSSINDSTMGSSQPRNRSTRDDDQPDPPDPPDNGSTKRKYKRHPKRDKNAPVKPLSAYVMFAHKVREEYAGQNISFPDMAKIVGDRWKNVRPEVKEAIENEAAKKKEEYQAELAVYKTTENWKRNDFLLLLEIPRISEGIQRKPYPHHSNYSHHSTNYIPPYAHYNPTVPYGYSNNNNGQNIGNSLATPPSSINTNNTQTTTLADLYAKDDNSDNSTTSSHSTPPAAFMETDDNPERRQSRQQNTQQQDSSQSCQQDDTNSSKSN
ncbi:20685_t:CDS:2 [Rhizophagus irregularis]|nr:20685_t:CDS:2 [Rhizophagus irregularis]